MASAGPVFGNVPVLESGYNFEEWTEVLEAWFKSNDITSDDKKKGIFFSGLGSKCYSTLRALVQPDKPAEKSYKDCKQALATHFAPKPTEIVQRYKFYTCAQEPNETIPQFCARLRQNSDGCNFKELHTMLRDRLVVGCRDSAIQRKLLSEQSLTFEKALNIATAMEVANRDVKEIQAMGKTLNIDKVKDVHKLRTTQQPQRQGLSQPSPKKTPNHCWRCGSSKHMPGECPFRTQKCFSCQKVGHTKSQCKKVQDYLKRTRKGKPSHHLESTCTSDEEDPPQHFTREQLSHIDDCTVNMMGKSHPYEATVKLNGTDIQMEIDTGSPRTIISKTVYNQIGNQSDMMKSSVQLRTYTGAKVPILGEALVDVKFDDTHQSIKLPLIVVDSGVSLLGRDWLQEAPVDLVTACHAKRKEIPMQGIVHNVQDALEEVLERHLDAFNSEKMGKLKDFQAKVYPQEVQDQPKFFKANPLPYAMRKKVDEALDELLAEGVIEPVKFSEYACPIVVVKKPNGKVRVCGNYKVTANQVLQLEQYPIPSLDDLLQDLEGGQRYTKLDLSHAYHQIELDPAARKYTTINTHRGLFQYTRLPFGISSAPALFQRTMESILADIPMCRPYLDDIIISGKSDQEHLNNLETVLKRLEDSGLHLRKEKCAFMQDSLEYLGHRLDREGIRPLQDKLDAIRDAPRPVNQSQLQAYIGLLGYYRKFIPNLSKEIAPLTQLLKAEYSSTDQKGKHKGSPSQPDPKFKWGSAQQQAFDKSKELLQGDQVLTHYNPAQPLLLQTDASPYGLGAVISQIDPDGQERPISFASRSLTPSEKNYAQHEKEGLSIIFGLKKYHKYLYGRSFRIVTDHKPLLGLFGEKPSSPMASARVARWQMILAAYDYTIEYKEGKKHLNADGLSRLPTPLVDETKWPTRDFQELDSMPANVNLLEDIDSRPVEAEEIKSKTRKDPVLSRVKSYIQNGWPESKHLDESFAPYIQKKDELSLEDDVVLWGHRVVIPQDEDMRQRLVKELHSTHPGIVKMKALARSYIWWPAIDKTLERYVRTCTTCQEHQHAPQHAPIHPWEFPDKPWSRLHIDYATIDNQEVLIVVDAHSKWIEAVRVHRATASATVTVMRRLFATHGIPETIVSDNGTQFISEEFEKFLSDNNVEHVQTAPKHPSSNGLAEQAVQTVKGGVKKTKGVDLEMKLQKFLFTYRLTPQGTTGKCPSELLYKRKIRCLLDNVRPNLSKTVKKQQSAMKARSDKHTKQRKFEINDPVIVKNFAAGPTWLRGRVVQVLTDSMYVVELNEGRLVRRHADHVRKIEMDSKQTDRSESVEDLIRDLPKAQPHQDENQTHPPAPVLTDENIEVPIEEPIQEEPSGNTDQEAPVTTPTTPAVEIRKSSRMKKPPERWRDFVSK